MVAAVLQVEQAQAIPPKQRRSELHHRQEPGDLQELLVVEPHSGQTNCELAIGTTVPPSCRAQKGGAGRRWAAVVLLHQAAPQAALHSNHCCGE